MKNKLKTIIFLCLGLVINLSTAQNAGDLFTDFGDNGKVNTNISQADFNVRSQAVQADGKIINVGSIGTSTSGNSFFILRLNTDGSLDTSFNGTGKIISQQMGGAVKVVIQTNGKIVISGTISGGPALMRYNSDGSLDTTFGINGIASNSNPSSLSAAIDFVIQEDGKFLVLTNLFTFVQEFNYDICIYKFNSDGSIDNTFGSNGSIVTNLGALEKSRSISLDSNGKFLVSGSSSSFNSGQGGFIYIVKYNLDGSLDTSFNSNGIKIFYNDDTHLNVFFSLDIQSDGKIIMAYTSNSVNGIKMTLFRLNQDSNLDTTFGINGVANFDVPSGPSKDHMKFRVQSNGKLFILFSTVQYLNVFAINKVLLMRVNSNGTLDTTFNNSGSKEFSFFEDNSVGGDFTVVGDKLIVSGSVKSLTSNKLAVAKLNLDGSFDESFDEDGKVFYFFPYSAYDKSTCSAIQADGKIIIAGYGYNYYGILTVCRYNTDGTIDSSFGENGFFKFNTMNASNAIYDIKVDSNGRILIGLDDNVRVMRLNSNGTLDTTFGVSGTAATNTSSLGNVEAMKILSDDSVLVAGYHSTIIDNEYSNNFLLAKFDVNGNLLPSFGTNGTSVLNSTILRDYLYAVDTQSDGKIIGAGIGNSSYTEIGDITVFRTDANGLLDPTFNFTATLNLEFTNFDENPLAMFVQSDDKILLAINYNNSNNTMLLRINANGTLDTSFGVNGYIYFDTLQVNHIASLKVINQEIIIGGTKKNVTSDFILMKLNINGEMVPTFGSNGIVATDFYSADDKVSGLLVANDNNIILTGTIFSPSGYEDFGMAKYYLNTQLSNNDYTKIDKVLFYPNPVKNTLYLSPEVESVVLFTLDGKRIETSIVNNTLSIENLPKGIYLLQMTLLNSEVISKKLVKE